MMRGPVQRVAAQAPMSKQEDDPEQEMPAWPDLVAKRDFLGAVTLLQVKKSDDDPIKVKEWLAYCHFHAGQYKQACTVYQALLAGFDPDPAYHAQLAACYFYMGKYELSEETALKGPDSQLKKRVLVHCAHASGSEDKLVEAHGKLDKRLLEDQLSLAAVHFRRSHFQEATDIYKRLLLENKTFLALNVFIALCYSRLDYYDISQEILKQYLSKVPDSVLAVNLKACNTFRLSNGRAAEEELQQLKTQMAVNLLAHDLIRHNLVVFRGGENALRDLQPLLGVIPEARLNLVIFHLRKGDTQIAFDLIKGLDASLPQEYILQGVVHAALGQQKQDAEMLKAAQQYFQLVGASASECDTIPGRQCMASCFHLLGQFDDVLIFLNSIAQYFKEDDDFAWNFGLALANTGSWAEAAEALQGIKNEAYLKDYWLQAWLARCHIMRKRPDAAWQLYVENADTKDSYRLLHIIGDECYGMGHFYYSAKAFQVLERLDPDGKYYEGKRGACIGCVQQMIAKHKNASPDKLDEILAMLEDSKDPGAADIVSTLQGWASAGGLIH